MSVYERLKSSCPYGGVYFFTFYLTDMYVCGYRVSVCLFAIRKASSLLIQIMSNSNKKLKIAWDR